MNKRILWLSISFLLLVILLIFTVIFKQTFTMQVRVPFTMFKVAQQFSDPALVARWYVPFTEHDIPPRSAHLKAPSRLQHDDYSLIIYNQNLVSTILESEKGNKKKDFLFQASPDSAKSRETVVELSYKNTLFNEWFNKGELIKNARLSLSNLKDYMEDPKRLYGYDIQVTTVADTAFLFTTATVPLEQKREATRRLFEDLISYSEKRNAGYTGVRILYSEVSENQITLYVSIGVSNKIFIDPKERFQYKLMPFGKKLLEANYQGLYGDVHKVYKALESFKNDHNLISMAIPFQKFMNDGYDFADSQLVQMKVYYPIF